MAPGHLANAQSDDPARGITGIVPFAAGGPTDTVARIVTAHMSNTLGQQIIVANVVGAGGTIAAIQAMRAPPDGYTIMMGHMGTHSAAVALNIALLILAMSSITAVVLLIVTVVIARWWMARCKTCRSSPSPPMPSPKTPSPAAQPA